MGCIFAYFCCWPSTLRVVVNHFDAPAMVYIFGYGSVVVWNLFRVVVFDTAVQLDEVGIDGPSLIIVSKSSMKSKSADLTLSSCCLFRFAFSSTTRLILT